jgi:predicted regulator of Ras-like GTPase activity (Roadblock/LC7/MglB family)
MIKSFLIISKDGVPLFTEDPGERTSDNTLIGCFLSAIQSFAKEVSNSGIDSIKMDSYSFFYSAKDPIFSIVAAEPTDDIDSRVYKIIAERLSRSFLQKYPKEIIEKKKGEISSFQEFKEDFKKISQEIESLQKQRNKDFILNYFTKAASDENIKGIIIFDLKEDKIIASDIPPDISEKSFESFSSMLFNFIDRMGSELKAGKINEVLMRAEKHWIGGFRKGDIAVFTIFSHEYFGNIIPEFITSKIE